MAKPVRVVAIAALLAGSLTARAQAAADLGMPTFPASTDDGSVMLWLKNHTSLGVGSFVAFAPDNVLVVLTDEVSTRSPSIHRISFRQEAVRIDFVSRTGGRSLRGQGEIDCATGSFRAETVELFSGSDLKGERIAGEGPDAVGRVPRAGSAPAIAAAQVCGGANAALSPLASTTRRQPTPVPAPAPAPKPEPAPLPAPAPYVAPEQPPATPAPARPLAPRRPLAAPTPLPPPGPAPAAQPPASPAPTPAPAQPAPPILAAPTETFAQIGAFGSREAAQRAWAHLAETFPDALAGKTMRIDQVTVNGATVFRSSIAGFSGQADAQALCNRLMASSESCFVRHGP